MLQESLEVEEDGTRFMFYNYAPFVEVNGFWNAIKTPSEYFRLIEFV